jgi:hypothetical protein
MLGRAIDAKLAKEKAEKELIISNTEKVLGIVERIVSEDEMNQIINELIINSLL